MINRGARIAQLQKPRILYGVTAGSSAYSLLRGQLSWFVAHGYEVLLATNPDEKAWMAADREGVTLHPVSMDREINIAQDLRSLWNWVRIIRRTRPQIVNLGTPKASLLGGLAARLLRVPCRVYVVRGLRLEGTRGVKRHILKIAELATMRCATTVIYVSHSLAEEAAKLGLVHRSQYLVIGSGSSNGVDVDAVQSAAEVTDVNELRSSLGFSRTDVVIGFIGRVTKDKGADTLVQAFLQPTLDPRAKLLMVGSPENGEIIGRAHALGNRAIITGHIVDLWRTLPAIDVLCLPTHREGFPNVILEAAALAIPSITTSATGARDAVVHEKTGLVIEPGDPLALSHAINRLVQSPDLRRDLGKSAQERAVREYKPERIWTGLKAIYDGTASHDNGPCLES